MDATVISPEYRQTLEGSEVLKKIRSVGVDPWRERFEWRPAVHSVLGGVIISADTATSVPGLSACGEASTGVHGANRLSGFALAECAVFGHRAGRSAAAHAAQAGRAALSAALVDPLAATAMADWLTHAAGARACGLGADLEALSALGRGRGGCGAARVAYLCQRA